MLTTHKLVSIVAPFYNEEEAVEPFYQALRDVLDGITDNSFEIICVDDGSRDDTLSRLISLIDRDPRFSVIELRVVDIKQRTPRGLGKRLGEMQPGAPNQPDGGVPQTWVCRMSMTCWRDNPTV